MYWLWITYAGSYLYFSMIRYQRRQMGTTQILDRLFILYLFIVLSCKCQNLLISSLFKGQLSSKIQCSLQKNWCVLERLMESLKPNPIFHEYYLIVKNLCNFICLNEYRLLIYRTKQPQYSFLLSNTIEQARLWACGRGDVSTPSFSSHPAGPPVAMWMRGHVHTNFWQPP